MHIKEGNMIIILKTLTVYNSRNVRQNNNQYNRMGDDYSYGNEDYYQNNGRQSYYDEAVDERPQNEPESVDASSQRVIQRHFDKFKK